MRMRSDKASKKEVVVEVGLETLLPELVEVVDKLPEEKRSVALVVLGRIIDESQPLLKQGLVRAWKSMSPTQLESYVDRKILKYVQ